MKKEAQKGLTWMDNKKEIGNTTNGIRKKRWLFIIDGPFFSFSFLAISEKKCSLKANLNWLLFADVIQRSVFFTCLWIGQLH